MKMDGRGYTIDRSQSLPGTPRRKSDQWHRLASVVRSTQKTFVPTPEEGSSSGLRCRTKLMYPMARKTDSIRGVQSLSRPPDSEQNLKKSQSRMRSLSRAYSESMPGKQARESYKNEELIISSPARIPVRRSTDVIENSQKFEKSRHGNRSKPQVLRKKFLLSEKSDKERKASDIYSLRYLGSFAIICFVLYVILLFASELTTKRTLQHRISRSLTQKDVDLLKKNLQENVLGQHLATKIISDLMESVASGKTKMSNGVDNLDGAKMAVFSLHGWTGVGKTFLSKLFVDSVSPERQMRFIIPVHFPHGVNDNIYQNTILRTVTTNLTHTGINVIIFDEMDKASDGVIKGIATTLLQLKVDNSYKDATVLVLLVSNSLGRNINNRLFSLLTQGRLREDLLLSDFNDIFHLDQKNKKSTRYQSYQEYRVFVEQNLIDSFVPFLPLNLDHVEECVRRSLQERQEQPHPDIVDRICEDLSLFSPPGSPIKYSHTGCKRVSEKVDLHSERLL